MALVYNEEKDLLGLTEEELGLVMERCGQWIADMEASGHHVASSALQSVRTATTVRFRNGRTTVTDGPFAETKEFLGGFSILEARDLNEAISLVSKMPVTRTGTVEIRPILDVEASSMDPLDSRLIAAFHRSAKTQPESEAPQSK
jgi:hypothetical protein